MTKVTASLIALVIIAVSIFAGDHYTKNLKIEPESSKSFSMHFAKRMTVSVQISSGDLGSGRIVAEVYDPSGQKVAGGSRGFSFNTKTTEGDYGIVVKNNSKNRQQVEVSVDQSDN